MMKSLYLVVVLLPALCNGWTTDDCNENDAVFDGLCNGSVPEDSEENKCTACDGKPKVICYFTSWAWYRQGIGKFVPSDIDPSLCTHITYAFAILDSETLTIKPADSWADLDNHFFTLITSMKGIIPLLSIGGWNDSGGNKYSRLVNNATARNNFIAQSVLFLEKYGFKGLDLDWEYPKCWQGNCAAGPESDKTNFGVFVKELSNVYKPKNLLLSAAVASGKSLTDNCYDVPSLSCYLDFINLMTYDYHSSLDGVTGANSPINGHNEFGTIQSLEYWESKGASPCKLAVGIPLYGHSYTLKDSSKNGMRAPSSGPGRQGTYTGSPGTLSYYEICLDVKNSSWHAVSTRDESTYAYKGDQWVSYCDVGDLEDRTWLIKEGKYAGAFIWALDYDDFTNACGCGRYPLLTTLSRELLGRDVQRVRCY